MREPTTKDYWIVAITSTLIVSALALVLYVFDIALKAILAA